MNKHGIYLLHFSKKIAKYITQSVYLQVCLLHESIALILDNFLLKSSMGPNVTMGEINEIIQLTPCAKSELGFPICVLLFN